MRAVARLFKIFFLGGGRRIKTFGTLNTLIHNLHNLHFDRKVEEGRRSHRIYAMQVGILSN